MWQRILAIWNARNKEFIRDRSALVWSLLFPLLIIAGFGYAFAGKPRAEFRMAVFPSVAKAEASLRATQYIDFIEESSLPEAIEKIRKHQLDLLLACDSLPPRYWINETSPKGYLMERLLKGAVAEPGSYRRQVVTGKPVRYVDWVVPGVIGMNIMFSALFGVGYVIVRYRKNGVLKRLRGTPLRPLEFLFAQLASRTVLIVATVGLVFLGAKALVHFPVKGSLLTLFFVYLVGTLCLISLGLILAARIRNEELANGLLNIMSLPMMFLSGVWFSLEGASPWVRRVAECLPLTHLIRAARAVQIDGAGLAEVRIDLLVLMVMLIFFLGVGSVFFVWE